MHFRRKPRTQIKLREAAELLQISRSSVRNLIADGTLQKVQVARGKIVKVYQAQVQELAVERGIL